MLKIYFIFIVFFSFLNISFAETAITRIEVKDNAYNVAFNGVFTISNIVLKEKNGEYDIVFPVYASKGKVYAQFGILKRNFRKDLAKALKEMRESDEHFETSFAINKFSLSKKGGNIKAFASVIFNDDIEVECRVMDGKNGLWVAWPSSKTDGKWRQNFEFTDKTVKNGVESLLIKEYTKKLNNENR